MNISILAKSTIAILAVVVLVTMMSGTAQNSQPIIDTGISLFWGVIEALIVITIIINLPKILRVLMMFL